MDLTPFQPRSEVRIGALVAAHTLGMALILLDHPLGLLRLVLVVGGLGLAVLLGGVLLLTLHLTLGLSYGTRFRGGATAEEQQQYHQEGNELGGFLHDDSYLDAKITFFP